MSLPVFKIFTNSQWQGFQKDGVFSGSPDDHRDGFIHLSKQEQIQGVLDRYFVDKYPVFIGEFSTDGFLDSLKWESASSGELFPHLYGRSLNKSEMRRWYKID